MYLIFLLFYTLNFIPSLQVVPLESPAGAYCIQVFLSTCCEIYILIYVKSQSSVGMFINSMKATILSWFISTAQLLINEHD